MTRFMDGPAAGVSLMLARAPLFLRVTFARTAGTWDGLDQLEDKPAPDEDVHVYCLIDAPTVFHVSRRPRSLSGWYQAGTYCHWPEQPPDDVLRDNKRWRAWTTEQIGAWCPWPRREAANS